MNSGLEDVIAAETVLSDVDGLAGRLVIRGRSLDDLVPHSSVEDGIELLWGGFFNDLPKGEELQKALGEARVQVFHHTDALDDTLMEMSPIEALRALMARIPDDDDLTAALHLMAAPAVFTTAILRGQKGRRPIHPDPTLPHSADILRMMNAGMPDEAEVAGLNTYLMTVSDHGLNASTFAARVVASTRAGLTSSLLAAISALKGPLHGGAPGPVLDMLDAIGRPDNAERWLESAVADGDRLMGFGHRVYRVRDPRADALKGALKHIEALEQGRGKHRVELAEAVEKAAIAVLRRHKPDRSLETNVEFYTALLLEQLGFPREAFTCVFAMGRTMGWIAHCREQVAANKLIRPQSRYVGPTVGLVA
ncbi:MULTISPECIES: citrate synthase/methylcitrate synthase [Brucella]|uniref:citrate synthase/methylcitrate synthase n=1 Tax=Brucella TaxID=234 RepID=UPI000F682A9D|nr:MULTISPECIES: citrate synthase/methylcitrate synthase [Brucella]KAB2751595.1 citrate synthase/methylcitrate synthase [Brucella anthropi]MDH0366527.1 citrate synthase/methylcitrate synthase [Brucella anthropi]RRY21893.1 citrate synthase/methylcitrate synthase [Brucella anthropi]UYT57943.1 citrate synthase/methylcitrate synthase [Brucella sp. MAB-22]